MSTRHTSVRTTLGELTLVATGDALTGLYFPHHWYAPDPAGFGPLVEVERDAVLSRARTEIDQYLAGERHDFDVRLVPSGDDFQRRVWDLVAAIPYGEVRTYGEIAAELGDLEAGDRSPAQRVGQAVARNPLCIFVPCHRVVGAGGKVTGYAGGSARKRRLLALEEPAGVRAGRLF